jgi:methyl-accepting chemotaxis protein
MLPSIKRRFLAIFLPTFIIIGIIVFGITYFLLNQTKEEAYRLKAKELRVALQHRIAETHKTGIYAASSLANNYTLVKSLESNNRKQLLADYKYLTDFYRIKLKEDNLKVHVHDEKSVSFLRSWNTEKYGDDLSYFRKSLSKVKNSSRVLSTFEVGKVGLAFRSIVPIYQNSSIYGTLEFIQNFDAMAESFKKEERCLISLVHSKYSPIATFLKAQVKVDEYMVNQEKHSKKLLRQLEKIDFKKFLKKNYIVTDECLIVHEYIRDFRQRPIGVFVLSENIDKVEYLTQKNSMNIYILFGVGFVSFLILWFALLVTVKNRVEFIETEDDE